MAVAVAAVAWAALTAGSAGAAGTPPTVSTQCPWVGSRAPIAQRVADVLSHMTLANEITIVQGAGNGNPYVFYMPGVPSLCIPPLGEEDGPAGVADQLTGVTQLPAGVALAATWDPSLAASYGRVIGAEEGGKGASVDLGPTVNIDRDPRWGRSFEAFTEDPFLNSAMTVGEIDGVQSQRVMSQVKHFDVYNQETNRNLPPDNAIVSKRTMHEIYMPAFQAAVQDAGAASVMCAYSYVNGAPACQSSYLLNTVLKQEWGFGGFVTSDYGAVHATSAAVQGTDQEQPENTYFGAPLAQAVTAGTIPKAVLNTMVERILAQMFRFGFIDRPQAGSTTTPVTTPGHVALATQVAADGATLLKNARSALPLSAGNSGTVAVIGPAASPQPVTGGGGSAYVIPSGTVTPLQGLQAAAGAGTHIVYSQGLPTDSQLTAIPASALTPAYAPTTAGKSYSGTLTAPETGTYVLAISNPCTCYAPTYLSLNGRVLIDNAGTPPVSIYSAAVDLVAGQKYTLSITGGLGSGGTPGGVSQSLTWAPPSALAPGIAQAAAAARSARTAVVVVADDTESEDDDRPSLNLPSAQDELISAVAAANPRTVVVVEAGAPVAMPWLSRSAAVLDTWYPGQSEGTSLARVLFGQVNPGGHLPVTFPKSLSQVPAHTTAQFPGAGNRVLYSEGLDVGYRWYDAKRVTPLFPFGYGLSYTRFKFSKLKLSGGMAQGTGAVQVSARIQNTGSRAGSDVAQLYLQDPRAAGEPPRQLVAFKRVTLRAHGSATVRFTVTPPDTWWWSQAANGWSQSTGIYGVYLGDSSATANLPLHGAFPVLRSPGARQVVISAPKTMRPGKGSTVRVKVTSGGNAQLAQVGLALQLPQGWKARARGPVRFRAVKARTSRTATYTVTPPAYAPAENVTVHATVNLGRLATRQAGVSVTVTG